jgi:hypothetical protein
MNVRYGLERLGRVQFQSIASYVWRDCGIPWQPSVTIPCCVTDISPCPRDLASSSPSTVDLNILDFPLFATNAWDSARKETQWKFMQAMDRLRQAAGFIYTTHIICLPATVNFRNACHWVSSNLWHCWFCHVDLLHRTYYRIFAEGGLIDRRRWVSQLIQMVSHKTFAVWRG